MAHWGWTQTEWLPSEVGVRRLLLPGVSSQDRLLGSEHQSGGQAREQVSSSLLPGLPSLMSSLPPYRGRRVPCSQHAAPWRRFRPHV